MQPRASMPPTTHQVAPASESGNKNPEAANLFLKYGEHGKACIVLTGLNGALEGCGRKPTLLVLVPGRATG